MSYSEVLSKTLRDLQNAQERIRGLEAYMDFEVPDIVWIKLRRIEQDAPRPFSDFACTIRYELENESRTRRRYERTPHRTRPNPAGRG